MAEDGDIGNARGESAANPQYLFEHHVRHLVARETQTGFVRADLIVQEALSIEHVIELERDAVAFRPGRLHLPDDDVVVAEPTPVIERNVRARARLIDHVLTIHGLEATAACQIVAHELRNVESRCGHVR